MISLTKRRLVAGAAAVVAAMIGGTCAPAEDHAMNPAPGPEQFAVVELYTSEGCSSCPPADRLLSELIAESKRDKTPVYALAFHVDYWDQLGWPDRFAAPAFTERQRMYTKARGAYTPQMVVNGTAEFVGSDADRARREIRKAMEAPVTAPLTIEVKLGEGGVISVRYSAMIPESVDFVTNASLHVALVEDGLTTEVKAGENKGTTLKHDAVVRAFTTVKPGNLVSGTVELKAPDDLKPENSRVVALIQHAGTLRVHGAASAPVN